MFVHNRITTGRIASNPPVRIVLVVVVLLSAIGASGALAEPAAAESTDSGAATPDTYSDGEELTQDTYSDGSWSGTTPSPAPIGPRTDPDGSSFW